MSEAKVLVIDDEGMIRWSIVETLGAAGYEVAAAETAAEGMALFRKISPAVVFLDVRLPDEDGLSVLKRMKEEGAPEAAVIIMTAFGEACTAAEAMRLGACEYLKKPFDFADLEGLTRRVLVTTGLSKGSG